MGILCSLSFDLTLKILVQVKVVLMGLEEEHGEW